MAEPKKSAPAVLIGGAAAFVLLAWLTNLWIALLVVVGLPVVGYLMLDSSQKRRLRSINRKRLGR